jgi:hypothetical protein
MQRNKIASLLNHPVGKREQRRPRCEAEHPGVLGAVRDALASGASFVTWQVSRSAIEAPRNILAEVPSHRF